MKAHTFGRYLLGEQLGRGGMATVFRARDPEFDRDVAIKVLPEDLLQDPEFRSRFQREARSIARLEHPAIVPVYDIGEQDGQPFLVMRFMPGGTLAQKLATGPLPPAEAVAVVRRIASALDEAHHRGMVHRDIKPGNILFDSYGDAYLSDFGIVKWSQAATTLTAGGMVGTPAYMSPEQSEGRGDVGPAADVYSLGAVLFQMLTGRLPFEADTPVGLALQHLREPVPQLSKLDATVPAGLQAVIERAMAKRPHDRFATAGDLARALEAAVIPPRLEADQQQALHRRPPKAPPQPRTLRAPRRNARGAWLVFGAAALGVAGVALVLLTRGSDLGLALRQTPTPSIPPSPVLPTSTTRTLPSSTPGSLASATVLPAGIGPENVGDVRLLWSSEIGRGVSFRPAWSPVGDTIAVSLANQTGIALWDANLARQTAFLMSTGDYHPDRLDWSPDGTRLAALVSRGLGEETSWRLDVWRLPEGDVVMVIPTSSTAWGGPRWSPDGRDLSFGPEMYGAESGSLLWTAPGTVSHSVFSPDGSLVALGGAGGDVRLFDVETGLPGLTLSGHDIAVTALAWSAKDMLTSGTWDGEILSWPGISQVVGNPSVPLTAETSGVNDLRWSPGGRVLLSGHLDRAARLWDESLTMLRAFEHDGVVLGLSWSPDGRRFATAAQDGYLRVWGLPPP